MSIQKSPWAHLKAGEMYQLVREGKISEHDFGEWLVSKQVEAFKEGYNTKK